jgi:hypothetical protein
MRTEAIAAPANQVSRCPEFSPAGGTLAARSPLGLRHVPAGSCRMKLYLSPVFMEGGRAIVRAAVSAAKSRTKCLAITKSTTQHARRFREVVTPPGACARAARCGRGFLATARRMHKHEAVSTLGFLRDDPTTRQRIASMKHSESPNSVPPSRLSLMVRCHRPFHQAELLGVT